jgi:hypothetical protein
MPMGVWRNTRADYRILANEQRLLQKGVELGLRFLWEMIPLF